MKLVNLLLLLLVQRTTAASADASRGDGRAVRDYHTFGANHTVVDLEKPHHKASFTSRPLYQPQGFQGNLCANQRHAYFKKRAIGLLTDVIGLVLLGLAYDYVSCESWTEIRECRTSFYSILFSLVTMISSVFNLVTIGKIESIYGRRPFLVAFATLVIGKLALSFAFLLCFLILADSGYSMSDFEVLRITSGVIMLVAIIGVELFSAVCFSPFSSLDNW